MTPLTLLHGDAHIIITPMYTPTWREFYLLVYRLTLLTNTVPAIVFLYLPHTCHIDIQALKPSLHALPPPSPLHTKLISRYMMTVEKFLAAPKSVKVAMRRDHACRKCVTPSVALSSAITEPFCKNIITIDLFHRPCVCYHLQSIE